MQEQIAKLAHTKGRRNANADDSRILQFILSNRLIKKLSLRNCLLFCKISFKKAFFMENKP
jgi:hypothetical protein